jgi:RNA polymerase sigma-70 factor (ECF subfamily)
MRDGTGRDGSFEAWYHAHAPRLTMTLTAASGDAALAEDAVSEAAARALARWRRVGAMPDPSAWVYRVALNELRRRLRRTARADELLNGADRPPVPEALRDLDLWQAVAALPERMRLAVALRYLGDLPEAQIAELMGITRGGVSSLLAKAMGQLASTVGAGSREEGHGRA